MHSCLLLVHGTGNDNIHLQHTAQMMQAFTDGGKWFELMLYPRKTSMALLTALNGIPNELLGRP